MDEGVLYRGFISTGRFSLFSGVVFTILCALTLESKAQTGLVNPHVTGGVGLCGECHSNPPELLADDVALCIRCHKGSTADHPVTMHPIDRVVRITTPSPLPLTRDKKIVCSTCHDPHASSGFKSFTKGKVQYPLHTVSC